MSPGKRCDQILQLIDEVLGDMPGDPPVPAAPAALTTPEPAPWRRQAAAGARS